MSSLSYLRLKNSVLKGCLEGLGLKPQPSFEGETVARLEECIRRESQATANFLPYTEFFKEASRTKDTERITDADFFGTADEE